MAAVAFWSVVLAVVVAICLLAWYSDRRDSKRRLRRSAADITAEARARRQHVRTARPWRRP